MTEFERIRDRELLRRFRGGDREGFVEIYRIHSKPVFRFALHVSADPAKAAEITQDVFVWLVHHPDQFDPTRGELGSFLVGVARKLLKSRFREDQRWVELEDSLAARARGHGRKRCGVSPQGGGGLAIALSRGGGGLRSGRKDLRRGCGDARVRSRHGAVPAASRAGVAGEETWPKESTGVSGMKERLDAAMRQWGVETAETGPPHEVEQAVLAEFDRSVRARQRVHWIATASAVAAALAVVVWMGAPRPVQVVESNVEQAEFTALPYVVQPALYERTEVVRMAVPVAELIAAGLPLRADPGGRVQADIVIGQDGRARAVRLVENFE
jgi:hypothetical protein